MIGHPNPGKIEPMTTASTAPVLRDVISLYRGDSAAGLTDEGLLRRFLDGLDDGEPDVADAAFAALMGRHGPMVLGVCRRALDDPNDVDDAFQATFLVLVRRARTVRIEGSLGRWLYGVARKVAARARSESGRRRSRLGVDPTTHADPSPADHPDRAEVSVAIDEELARLPERYRAPILLCGLDGLSYEEAAGRLRWPVGTLKSRLSRGRERLAARLTRRGIAPGVVMPILGRMTRIVPETLAAATLASVREAIARGNLPEALRVLVRPGLGRVAPPIAKAGAVGALALGIVGMALIDVRAGSLAARPLAQKSEAVLSPKEAIADVAAKTLRPEDLKPAPGCTWEIKPNPLSPGDSSWGQAGKEGPIAYDMNFGAATGSIRIVVVRAQRRGQPEREVRPVLFDLRGGRHELKSVGSIFMGGDVDFGMASFEINQSLLPASPAFVGIERLTPEFHRLAGIRARVVAKADGLAILPPPRVGEPFDFDLPIADGRRVRSADLRGKVVVIDGWATWCSPCMDKMPKLKAFRDAHREGLEVVGVCFSEQDASRREIERLGIDWPQVFVPMDEKTRRLWFEGSEIPGLPHILLIDRAGVLRAVCMPDEVEAKAATLLGERGPR